MVFTALYAIDPAAPKTPANNIGAITPSLIFSAIVSITALVIPFESRLSVSLPTMYESCFLDFSILPSFKYFITLYPSTTNPLADIQK